MTQANRKPKRKAMRLQEVLRERDAASATAMELVKMCERLIERLRATRMCMVEDDVREAQALLKKISKGGKFKS
jgi:hypothetical protein